LTLLGTLMLGPVLVLTPLVDAGAGQASRLAVTFAIFAKGLSTMLVATVTASTLTLAGIHQGLATLPLPRLLIAVVVQVFMQAGMLARETARMARAIAVRRAAVGVRHAVTTLAGVSSGWTHRLLFKVERVAAAMELRGFDGTDPPGGVPAGRARDAVALALAAAWTAGVIAVRLGGAR
jgi:energy-coupling factor transporter transmembrane protein EcfT